ncbi:MAG TPA: hypothetical protein IAC84_05040 [Firmicutes bacterium]|nr:hypothetical protein [Bacillota bacterium]
MNGIEKIIQRIQSDAKAQADEIVCQARTQAQEILDSCEMQGDRQARAILEQGHRTAQQHRQRLDSALQMECRNQTLQTKQQMIEQAFQLALEKLRSLPRDEYVALLAKLAAGASSTGRGELIFSPADRDAVGRAVVAEANRRLGVGGLTLSEQTRELEGGFILSDGAVEVNCSFGALLRAHRERLAGPVAAALFP